MRNVGLLALRLAVGIIFISHGWGKLADIGTTTSMFENFGFPAAAFFAWLVGLVEFVGGLAVFFGFFVRAAAKLLAIVMLTALLFVHTKMPFSAAELPLALLGANLALFGLGGGDWVISKKDCTCKMCGGNDGCGGACACDSNEKKGSC